MLILMKYNLCWTEAVAASTCSANNAACLCSSAALISSFSCCTILECAPTDQTSAGKTLQSWCSLSGGVSVSASLSCNVPTPSQIAIGPSTLLPADPASSIAALVSSLVQAPPVGTSPAQVLPVGTSPAQVLPVGTSPAQDPPVGTSPAVEHSIGPAAETPQVATTVITSGGQAKTILITQVPTNPSSPNDSTGSLNSATLGPIAATASNSVTSVHLGVGNSQASTGFSNPSLSSTTSKPQNSSSATSAFGGEATSVKNGVKLAIAGIAIGGVLGILLLLLLIYLLLRYRKAKKARESEILIPREPELPTIYNTHEIEGKKTGYELMAGGEEIGRGADLAVLPELPTDTEKEKATDNVETQDTSEREAGGQERDLNEIQVPKTTFSQPYPADCEGLEFNPEINKGDAEIEHTKHEQEISTVSEEIVLPDGGGSSETFSVMEELRARRGKIIAEKERLFKLQELDEMEAEVQREIIEEQRKSAGITECGGEEKYL
jgi:CFEM domain